MSAFSMPYGKAVLNDITIPIIKAGSDDFAVGGDWTPQAGDVKLSKDAAAANNIGTLPTYVTNVGWKFVFTAAELQARHININIVDSATKAIKDQHFVIETFGHASANTIFDLNDATPTVNVTQINGSTAPPELMQKSIFNTGTAEAGSTSTTFEIDTDTLFTANEFNELNLLITGGTGAGQMAKIRRNVGNKAYIYGTWVTTPDATSTYIVYGPKISDPNRVLYQGLCQAGSTSSTIKFDTGASSVNDFYNRRIVRVVNGTGIGQERTIYNYDGPTRVATIHEDNWSTTPDATSEFQIMDQFSYALGFGSGDTHVDCNMEEIAASGPVMNNLRDTYNGTGYANAKAPASQEALAALNDFDPASETVTVGTNNDKTGYTVSTNNDKTGYSVSTNNDKTGYTLSAAGIAGMWNALTSGMVTVGSIGKKLADLVFGTDNKILISTDAQDLNATLSVNAKAVAGSTAGATALASLNISGGIVESDAVKIEGQALSAKVGDNFNLFYQNAGGDTTKVVDDVGGSGTALNAQETRDAMKLAPTVGAPAAGSVDEHLDDIDAKTTQLNFSGAAVQADIQQVKASAAHATTLDNWIAVGIGTDNLALVSTDAQDLSGTFAVNAKAVGGSVPAGTALASLNIAAGVVESNSVQISGSAPAANNLEAIALASKGVDNKILLSTDDQDLGGTLHVDSKRISNSAAAADAVESNIGFLDVAVSSIKAVTDLLNITAGNVHADIKAVAANTLAATNMKDDYNGTGFDKTNSSIGSVDVADELGAQAKIDVNDQVDDVLNVQAQPELAQGIPPNTESAGASITRIRMQVVNKGTQTANEKGTFNSAGTKISKKAVSDDGNTYTEDKAVSGA